VSDNQNTSIVQIPRDYSDIAALQDPSVLEEFLEQPLTFIAETITGAISEGKKGMFVAGGRIVQALLKGRLFDQFAKEFKAAREKGKLADDFAEKKFGFQTWVELMTVIDEETPDAERLEALKAMFFAVNRPNITDQEQITEYQLWQVVKQLKSGELHLLKTAYQNRTVPFGSNYSYWASKMAEMTGFRSTGLVDLHEKKLMEACLISQRTFADLSGISPKDARLTDLGIRVCTNIEKYRIQSKSAK
jgi:hypothetical protein